MNNIEKKFILAVLTFTMVFAAGMFLYSRVNKKEATQYGQVIYGKDAVMLEFDMNKDAIYHLKGDYGKFSVEVKDGKYRMVDVECPNHVCEGMGWQPDDLLYLPIQCFPNNVAVITKFND